VYRFQVVSVRCLHCVAGRRAGVRACLHTCLRRVGLGGERKWGRDGDHQSSTDHDPAYRSFLFFPPLFSLKVCVCVAVEVCGSIGVSLVRVRLLGILHFKLHTRPGFFLLANRH
jgi:hypothetical protein